MARFEIDGRADLAGPLDLTVGVDRAFKDKSNIDIRIWQVGLACTGAEKIETFQPWPIESFYLRLKFCENRIDRRYGKGSHDNTSVVLGEGKAQSHSIAGPISIFKSALPRFGACSLMRKWTHSFLEISL